MKFIAAILVAVALTATQLIFFAWLWGIHPALAVGVLFAALVGPPVFIR